MKKRTSLFIGFLPVLAFGIAGFSMCRALPDAETMTREELTRGHFMCLACALSMFYLQKHDLPETLDPLTISATDAPALARVEDLSDSWGDRIRYTKISATVYELRSAGRDGRMKTRDDLCLHKNVSEE